jgi:hypothetical protein
MIMPKPENETEAMQWLLRECPDIFDGLTFWRGYEKRRDFIETFGFSILDRRTVDLLHGHSPILEVGAGTGYWSHELRKAGADVVATDLVPGEGNKYRFTHGYGVEQLGGVEAVHKYPGRTLLLVWPDYDADWSEQVLDAYMGSTVLYVGEGEGGCTATDRFHEMLSSRFPWITRHRLHQFYGIHDCLSIC